MPFTVGNADRIDRFDPSSGDCTTAQAEVDPATNWPPLVTADALWQTQARNGTVTIQALDLRTLRQTGSVRIAAPPDRHAVGAVRMCPSSGRFPMEAGPRGQLGRPDALSRKRRSHLLPRPGQRSRRAAGNRRRPGRRASCRRARQSAVCGRERRQQEHCPAAGPGCPTGVVEDQLDSIEWRHGQKPAGDQRRGVGDRQRRALDSVRFSPLSDLARSRIISYLGEVSATVAGGMVWIGGSGESCAQMPRPVRFEAATWSSR